ncbi:MAG: flotillin family protein [Anaerolineales bacterium]|nr:flotillin family protein [Anaerolineales bacterium]MCB9126385.1 flotillin family protein [Ardenticatenales bacterium]MCB9171546.1 flotillin family protein [Ardenticatenales bacterium]
MLYVILAVVALLALIILAALLYAWRFQKVGPNEVLVISGRRGRIRNAVTGEMESRNYRLVKGGGTFVLPIIERVDDLSLEIMTIDVVTPKVYTVQGVPITVDGVAQIKVKGDDVSIATAAEQFLSKTTEQIKHVALQTMEGHLRSILGTLSVEEVYKDRDAFAQEVQEVAATDMSKMGLGIVSFTIRDIRDDQGYLDALGQARTAEVKRDAQIGQANADRDARIQAARAMQEAREAEFVAETKVAEAQKSFSVQKAEYDAEVNRRNAEAEQAYNFQTAVERQKVREQEVQIEVVERQKAIEVARQEAERTEKELEATIRKPAEAEQYRLQRLADANLYQREAQARAEAALIRAKGEAEAQAQELTGLAAAKVVQAQGEAEAVAMHQKAEAWASYNQAAILDRLMEQLPQIAAAVSEPLSRTDKIVVIGGGSGGTGIDSITGDVTRIIAQMPAAVEALTGIDVISSVKNLSAIQSSDNNGQPRKG